MLVDDFDDGDCVFVVGVEGLCEVVCVVGLIFVDVVVDGVWVVV